MNERNDKEVLWQEMPVTSPLLERPTLVIAARGVPTGRGANRLQSLNLYLPHTAENRKLIGSPAASVTAAPGYAYVHVHGGAWRDPHLTATSVEPIVAHAFQDSTSTAVGIIAGVNYTISKFPTHPDDPYDPAEQNHTDSAREGVHPQHVNDVIQGLNALRAYGFVDGSYVLSCHSCGACIAFQALLHAPSDYGLKGIEDPPRPAAIASVNGLYDLPSLVYDLGQGHQHLSGDYRTMLTNAYGPSEAVWRSASPAHFDPQAIASRVSQGRTPCLILLDQSEGDQLVPLNQIGFLEATLRRVNGLKLIRGNRAHGYHAMPWEGGLIFWQTVQDVLTRLD